MSDAPRQRKRAPQGGKILDPEFTRERASKAAKAQHSLDAYVNRIVRDAPDLTPEHAEQLRSILPPVPAQPQAGADDDAA